MYGGFDLIFQILIRLVIITVIVLGVIRRRGLLISEDQGTEELQDVVDYGNAIISDNPVVKESREDYTVLDGNGDKDEVEDEYDPDVLDQIMQNALKEKL